MSEPEPDAAEPARDPVATTHDPAVETVTALDVDGVGAIAVGTVAWTVALVLCLVFRTSMADAGRGWWIWVCLTGALLGLPGLWFVRRRRDAYAAHGH